MGKITINDAYLSNQEYVFTVYEDGSDILMNGPISVDLRLKTGGPDYTPGLDLKAAAEKVRVNFAARATMFNEQSGFLRNGIPGLLENSHNIESLNKVSADDFEYYVEETSSGGGTGTPSGSTTGGGGK